MLKVEISIYDEDKVVGTRIKNAHLYQSEEEKNLQIRVETLLTALRQKEAELDEKKKECFMKGQVLEAIGSGLRYLTEKEAVLTKGQAADLIKELYTTHKAFLVPEEKG